MGQTIVKGSRYPTAPAPWKGGIQPYGQAKATLPPAFVQQGDSAHVITCEFMVEYAIPGPRLGSIRGKVEYYVVPHGIVQGGEPQVSYYVASRHRLDYAISPDKLDEFIQNISSYYIKSIELPHVGKFRSPYLSGRVFPTASDAWQGGVMPYVIAKGQLPSVQNTPGGGEYFLQIDVPVISSDGNLTRYKTFLVPHLVWLPEPVVKYYIHYDPQLHTNIFAVGPDAVEELANRFWHYYEIARQFLKADSDFEAQSLAVEYYALNGDWGAALRSLGRSWVAAVQDPKWWLFYFGLPMVDMLLVRGAAANAAKAKIRGTPDATVAADAARELEAAEFYATKAEVTEVHLGQEAKTTYKSPANEKFPDVVAKKKDGSYGLGEGKGTDMEKVIKQFDKGAKRIGGKVSEQVVVVPRLTKQTVPGGKVYPSPGGGWGVDAQGFLIDLTAGDPATWVRVTVNGQPIKVVVKKP